MSVTPYRPGVGAISGAGILANYLRNPAPYNRAANSMARFGRSMYRRFQNSQRSARYRTVSRRRQYPVKKRNFIRSGQGTTTQHDRSYVYRKRSMPRFKRKAWKRFVRKVHAVSEKSLGSKTIVFNNQVQTSLSSSTTNGTQLLEQVALYPVKNGTYAHLDDLFSIFANYTGDADYDPTDRLLFQSAVLDLTLTNSSFDSSDPAVNVPIELDVYEITSSDSWQENSDASSTNINLITMLNRGFTDTGNEGSASSGLALNQRGVTPFECCSGLSSFRIKIWKKTKYFLGTSQTMTYQIRDPKRHVWSNTKIGSWESGNMPRATRWLLFIAKSVPGYDMDGTGRVQIDIGVTRKYMYKVNKSSRDADASNP